MSCVETQIPSSLLIPPYVMKILQVSPQNSKIQKSYGPSIQIKETPCPASLQLKKNTTQSWTTESLRRARAKLSDGFLVGGGGWVVRGRSQSPLVWLHWTQEFSILLHADPADLTKPQLPTSSHSHCFLEQAESSLTTPSAEICGLIGLNMACRLLSGIIQTTVFFVSGTFL